MQSWPKFFQSRATRSETGSVSPSPLGEGRGEGEGRSANQNFISRPAPAIQRLSPALLAGKDGGNRDAPLASDRRVHTIVSGQFASALVCGASLSPHPCPLPSGEGTPIPGRS